MTTFELVPRGPYSLAASAAFLEGFSPAAHRAAGEGHLHLAFVPDGEGAAAWALIGHRIRTVQAARVKERMAAELGEAAAVGQLDGDRLRALPREEALAELKRLPGIGDFSAELVLLRGAADPDHLPLHEPRLCRGAALAYGLGGSPDRAWLEKQSEAWRPYRTWVVLLLRVLLEAETGEIGGTRDVGGRPRP
jgi:DNA-3-methyladenine glycosylase II